MDREMLLAEIIERELAMFLSTRNEGGKSECQERPDTFRLMRRMAHEAHGVDFLRAYLDDLRNGEKEGRNLVTEKYARMDDLLPPLSDSPLLDEIADAESHFLRDATRAYPHIIPREGWNRFRRYLRCELETLSPRSLALYADEIRKAQQEGKNPVLERYEWYRAAAKMRIAVVANHS